MKRTCPECGRVFDLLDEVDANESAYGHDCEVNERVLFDMPEDQGADEPAKDWRVEHEAAYGDEHDEDCPLCGVEAQDDEWTNREGMPEFNGSFR